MTTCVVDASVALKWLIEEDDSILAAEFAASPHELHAPDFLQIEAANAIWRRINKGELPVDFWPAAQQELILGFSAWHRATDLLPSAMELSISMQHPVYDCLYLALAKKLDCLCVTADRRLLAAARAASLDHFLLALPDWRRL